MGESDEIADLKRRLAEAERNEDEWRKDLNHSQKLREWAERERDEARAEAAALREAADRYLGSRSLNDLEQLAGALSQPGPGAAMLERVRKLEQLRSAAQYTVLAMEWENRGDLDIVTALAALKETT